MKDKLDEILSDFLASNYGVYKGIGDTTEAKDRINEWKDQEMQRVVDETRKEVNERHRLALAVTDERVKQLEQQLKDLPSNEFVELLQGQILSLKEQIKESREVSVQDMEDKIDEWGDELTVDLAPSDKYRIAYSIHNLINGDKQ